jgi:hypothetical protein
MQARINHPRQAVMRGLADAPIILAGLGLFVLGAVATLVEQARHRAHEVAQPR